MNDFEKLLISYRKKSFLVVEPGGFYGDNLIYLGLYKKLKALRIGFEVLRYEEKWRSRIFAKLYWTLWIGLTRRLSNLSEALRNKFEILTQRVYNWLIIAKQISTSKIPKSTSIVLIQAGGSFNDLWGVGIRIMKNAIESSPNSVIIVAPESYWFRGISFAETLSTARQGEIYLFCREKYSYRMLKAMDLRRRIHIGLADDTSFFLSREDFHPEEGRQTLICFREDRESILPIKTRSFIQSLKKTGKANKTLVLDIGVQAPNFQSYVETIEKAGTVFTDRLHVAILSTILGKNTFLYPNRYHKSKGVYQQTLHKFPNTGLVEDPNQLEELILKEIHDCSVSHDTA